MKDIPVSSRTVCSKHHQDAPWAHRTHLTAALLDPVLSPQLWGGAKSLPSLKDSQVALLGLSQPGLVREASGVWCWARNKARSTCRPSRCHGGRCPAGPCSWHFLGMVRLDPVTLCPAVQGGDEKDGALSPALCPQPAALSTRGGSRPCTDQPLPRAPSASGCFQCSPGSLQPQGGLGQDQHPSSVDPGLSNTSACHL